MFDAVLWDFGGVLTTSPFDAFADYERVHELPAGFLRGVNATAPDTNAWALFERAEIDADEFDRRFGDESAALGHRVAGADVIAMLAGRLRPEMVSTLDDVIAAGLRTACLTNNVAAPAMAATPEVAAVMARFDLVVESSKIGRRKPEPEFYVLACEQLGVEPGRCVFLDDLGINLKPARALGMTTIKVVDPAVAIGELRSLLDLAT